METEKVPEDIKIVCPILNQNSHTQPQPTLQTIPYYKQEKALTQQLLMTRVQNMIKYII